MITPKIRNAPYINKLFLMLLIILALVVNYPAYSNYCANGRIILINLIYQVKKNINQYITFQV